MSWAGLSVCSVPVEVGPMVRNIAMFGFQIRVLFFFSLGVKDLLENKKKKNRLR